MTTQKGSAQSPTDVVNNLSTFHLFAKWNTLFPLPSHPLPIPPPPSHMDAATARAI